jgi:hypothetical protein
MLETFTHPCGSMGPPLYSANLTLVAAIAVPLVAFSPTMYDCPALHASQLS